MYTKNITSEFFSKFVSSVIVTIIFFRFYNINVFYSFLLFQCTWLYHIMRGYTYIYTSINVAIPHLFVHIHVAHRIPYIVIFSKCVSMLFFRVRIIGGNGGSCTNCGVSNGLCARCLDLPYCKICKRHLSDSCFNEGQCHICQVPKSYALQSKQVAFNSHQ